MKITEIQIKNFGKLHNINIRPLPGINVIYGENETGKSTLQQFITGMLFGIEKQKGPGSQNDSYRQYEPWNDSSSYSGGLKFTVDGKPFFLERNFYHKEPSVKLVNEKDLEELSVEQGDLEMLLGGMNRETYENTFCIRQADVETDREFSDILQNYFVNASLGQEGGIDLTGARKRLKEGQERAARKLQEKREERKNHVEKLLLEEKLLKKDTEQLKKQKSDGYKGLLHKPEGLIPPEHDINQMAEYLRDIRQQKEQRSYHMRFGLSLFFMLAALWAGIWNGLAHRLFQGAAPGWIILEAALCVLLLAECCGMRFWHRKSKIGRAHV